MHSEFSQLILKSALGFLSVVSILSSFTPSYLCGFAPSMEKESLSSFSVVLFFLGKSELSGEFTPHPSQTTASSSDCPVRVLPV